VASEALEIRDAVPQFVPCLLCGQVDGVRRVPVAHDEACAEYPPRRVYELAVVPRREKRAGRVLGAGVTSLIGVFFGIDLVGAGTGNPGASAFMAACFLAAALSLPSARWAWRQGWYCRRRESILELR
jgi:hypothetical protein